MKRLAALIILLAFMLAACVAEEWDEFPTAPEITAPGATEEPLPTPITEPEPT